MYVKRIPRELVVITVDDPCILLDGFIFIWTPIIICRYKRKKKKIDAHGKACSSDEEK
jgi:hypothetical protein